VDQAVTCFVVRTEFRWQGFTDAFSRAAVEFARQRGAPALEGYAMITTPGREITGGELHLGGRSAFAAAGLDQVSRPTERRAVMRIDRSGNPARGRGPFVEGDSMRIHRQIVVFDAADLAAESSFWARLLGGTVAADDDWHMILVDGEARLGIQLAPNHVPPEWPDGTPQQIHLDLYVDDVPSAHDEVISFGAKLLRPADDIKSPEGYQVYTDPAGHPFCLCWGE